MSTWYELLSRNCWSRMMPSTISISQHWHWCYPGPLAPPHFPTPVLIRALSLSLATAFVRVHNGSQLKLTAQKSFLVAMLPLADRITASSATNHCEALCSSVVSLDNNLWPPSTHSEWKQAALKKITLASYCTSHSLGTDPFFLAQIQKH